MGLVVLTLSRDDYDAVLIRMGIAASWMANSEPGSLDRSFGLLNRMNEGNPRYTPYQVNPSPDCKSSAPPH